MITFTANRRRAVCASNDRLTTGSVGIPVEFSFDGWDGIVSKIAVFRSGDVSIDVALLEDACTVPPEVLTTPGETMTVGVYGTDGAGTVVIPTVYADAGRVVRGAEPSGIDPTPPTPSLVEQLLAATQAARTAAQAAQDAADDANALAQGVREDADDGVFDGADGKSAYEIAVDHGYEGTEAEWLESLHGEDGVVLRGDGEQSTVENDDSTATGEYAHAEGRYTLASGNNSHAEGMRQTGMDGTESRGRGSHAEGVSTLAAGTGSHAEGGRMSHASGTVSHAEGMTTTAGGTAAHAEGLGSKATGDYAHAEGGGTIASKPCQIVLGVNNAADTGSGKTVSVTSYLPDGTVDRTINVTLGELLLILGNGDSDAARSNALTVDVLGNLWLAGSVTLGETELTEAQLQQLLQGGGGGGVSPTVTIETITGGHRVTITDEDHPSGQSFDVMDGQDGSQGPAGQDGAAGADGVSPGVTISSITGGHRVVITDKTHPSGQSFDVMDGQDGSQGPAGADGADGTIWWTSTAAPATPNYTFNIADLAGPTGASPAVGDLILYSYYRYTISSVGSTTVLAGNRQSLRGAQGAAATVDATLTQSGEAADAKATGDTLATKADKVTEVAVSNTGDITQTLDPGKIYHFTGAISSLTLTLATPASGQLAQYHFDFDSGSTAATISISGVTWPEGSFTPEASTHYEVDILNGYGLYIGWEAAT